MVTGAHAVEVVVVGNEVSVVEVVVVFTSTEESGVVEGKTFDKGETSEAKPKVSSLILFLGSFILSSYLSYM